MTQLLLLIAVIIWGMTFVVSKICLEVMSPIQLVAGRFLIAAPALFLVARLRGASFRLGAHKKVLLLAVVIFSFHYLLQTWALEFTTATNSGWLVTVTPLTICKSPQHLGRLLGAHHAHQPAQARERRAALPDEIHQREQSFHQPLEQFVVLFRQQPLRPLQQSLDRAHLDLDNLRLFAHRQSRAHSRRRKSFTSG